MVKEEYEASYSITIEDGKEVISVQIMTERYFPIYRPASLHSMKSFIIEEISSMDEINACDIEVAFTKVDHLQIA